MDSKLSKKHQLQQELYRRFAQNEVKPIARDMDEKEEFSLELLGKMQKYGFLGIPYSRDYGGAGSDTLSYVLCMEELAKVDASTALTVSVHTSLCCWCIESFGREDQKEKYLRPLVSGKKAGCFSLTEPNAGSDASAQQTKAVRDGDHYVLNGSKVFTTNSGFADVFVLFAMTDRSQGTRGITAFIIERESEGLSVSDNIPRMGMRAASNCVVALENVRLPETNRLGREGEGFKIAMKALEGGRIGIGAQAVGIAQGALDETIDYVKKRKQFGRPISAFQNTQFKIAEMQTKINAARLMVWSAAEAKDNHESYGTQAAMCKLYASEVANDVTRECIQLMGGYGYTREFPIERMMRDAKITEIYEGTSEIMKIIISGAMKIK